MEATEQSHHNQDGAVVVASVSDEALREIEQERSLVTAYATALVVDSADRFIEAGEYLVRIAKAKARVHEMTDPVCDAAYKAHKAATKQRADLLAPFEADEKVVGDKAVAWKREQDRLADEAARAAQVEAQRKADADREKLAKKAEAIGDTTMAQGLRGEIGKPSPMTTMAAPVRTAPKVAGLTIRTNWRAEHRLLPNLSLRALIQAAAKDPAYEQYLTEDWSRLHSQAKAQQDRFDVPGYHAVDTMKATGRR